MKIQSVALFQSSLHGTNRCTGGNCKQCQENNKETEFLYTDIGAEDSMFGVVMLAKRHVDKVVRQCKTMREKELNDTKSIIDNAFSGKESCEIRTIVQNATDFLLSLSVEQITSPEAKGQIQALGMLAMRSKWLRDWEKEVLRWFTRAVGTMSQAEVMNFLASEITLFTSYRWPAPKWTYYEE